MIIGTINKMDMNTEMTLRKSQNTLINLYQEMLKKDLSTLENIERGEVLKGAELIGKILDVSV